MTYLFGMLSSRLFDYIGYWELTHFYRMNSCTLSLKLVNTTYRGSVKPLFGQFMRFLLI